MSDRTLREAYGRILAERRPRGRAECVAPEALAAIVSGDATEDERLERLRHVAQCSACRAELDLMRAAAAASRSGPVFRTSAWAAAAAVVLLMAGGAVLWRVTGGDGPPVMRGTEATVELVAPLGETSREQARTFVWRGLGQALDYDVELLGPSGEVIFTTTTFDTLVAIPESTSLTPGREYRWRVRARQADGVRVTSELRPFRISSP